MPHFLGIDGGGTRTTAWLARLGGQADRRGCVLARAEAGPSNPLKVGLKVAQREILRAARSVVGAGFKPAPTGAVLEAVVAGIAGVDRPQIHRPLARWLRKAIPARFHLLTTDAAIALHAALGNAPGIIVVSGTGSIAYGQDGRGRVFRAGGWGSQFDDAGSGYDLGRKAIAAALRAHDGRGPRTQLTAKICRAFKLRDITQVVGRELTSLEIAGLFPLVLEAARRRDAAANQLLDDAGRDLAELALALVKRERWSRRPIPVVLAGGVFHSSARVRRSFVRQLRRTAPRARVTLLRRAPVEGALDLARKKGVL